MPEAWCIRGYRPGDEEALNNAFNRVFGKARPLVEWKWKYTQCPWGVCIALAQHTSGQILAHVAAIPTLFQVLGEEFLVGQGVDALRVDLGPAGTSHPEVYLKTLRFLFQHYCGENGLRLMYSVMGSRHAKLQMKRFGATACGSPKAWVATPGPLPRPSSAWEFVLGFHPVLWEELWERCRSRYQVAAIRNWTYAHWRYGQHPSKPYSCLFLLRHEQPAACAVLRLVEGTLFWVDLLWDGQAEALCALARAVRGWAAQWGAHQVDLWLQGDNEAEEILPQEGFQRSSAWKEAVLMAKSFVPTLNAEAFGRRLYLTHGDGDLF
jgi:hypothetical protein